MALKYTHRQMEMERLLKSSPFFQHCNTDTSWLFKCVYCEISEYGERYHHFGTSYRRHWTRYFPVYNPSDVFEYLANKHGLMCLFCGSVMPPNEQDRDRSFKWMDHLEAVPQLRVIELLSCSNCRDDLLLLHANSFNFKNLIAAHGTRHSEMAKLRILADLYRATNEIESAVLELKRQKRGRRNDEVRLR